MSYLYKYVYPYPHLYVYMNYFYFYILKLKVAYLSKYFFTIQAVFLSGFIMHFCFFLSWPSEVQTDNQCEFFLAIQFIRIIMYSFGKSLGHQHQLLMVSLQLMALDRKDLFFNDALLFHIQTRCFSSTKEKPAYVRSFLISFKRMYLVVKKKKKILSLVL